MVHLYTLQARSEVAMTLTLNFDPIKLHFSYSFINYGVASLEAFCRDMNAEESQCHSHGFPYIAYYFRLNSMYSQSQIK